VMSLRTGERGDTQTWGGAEPRAGDANLIFFGGGGGESVPKLSINVKEIFTRAYG
jgi:hypothetical protein